MNEHFPVLIVGAGPVGLALAGDLGWRGVASLTVEQTDGTIFQPKMDMVSVRTMEICRRWGIAEWVEKSRYPLDYPQDNVYLTTLNGFELGRQTFPPRGLEMRPEQSPQKRERCPQDIFDPILQRFVNQYPHANLRLRTEFIDYTETPETVRVRLKSLDTGETYVVTTDYLVGCDGGSSKVRAQAGITMVGEPLLTYTTNVLFRSESLPAVHDKGLAYRFIFIGPEGTWATLVAINGGDLWRFSHVGTSEKRTYTTDELRAFIIRAVGKEFDFEIISVLPWVRRELVASSYGSGRVYIAGDAAHLTSPTGGFGMNTGIGDAVDLGWKLQAMLEHWGGPELLASYGEERRPIAERNVREASGNLKRMLSPRENKPPRGLFEPGSENDELRETYGAWYCEQMNREWFTLGIHLGYRYDNSPVIWADGSPQPPMPVTSYEQIGRPGARAPHAWLDDGRSTLDLFGSGFTLLRLGRDASDTPRLINAAEAVGMPLRVETLTEQGVRDLYGAPLVLVRPDGHVAWRGQADPVEAENIIDLVRGATRRSVSHSIGRVASGVA